MKKPVIAGICGALAVTLIGGSILGYNLWSKSRITVPVQNVSSLQGYYGDNSSSSGVVTTDLTQEIYLNSEMIIEEILVKEGDTVTVGTPLIKYDATLANLDLEMQALSIDNIDIQLEAGRKELEQLKNAKTYTAPPQINADSETDGSGSDGENTRAPEGLASRKSRPHVLLTSTGASEADPDMTVYRLDENTVLFLKDGTSNVYEVKCAPETIITKAFLNKVKGLGPDGKQRTEPLFVVLKIPDRNLRIYLDGYALQVPEDMQDMDLITFINTYDIPISETPGENSEQNPFNGITPDEKKKKISDKESAIKSLELDRKEAVLKYEQMKKKVKGSVVKSTVNGQVKSVGDPEQAPDSGTAFMVVASNIGYYVKGSINELQLNDVSIGQTVSVVNPETGMMNEAKITSISTFPASSDDMGYGYNPNTSSYPFTAYIEDDAGFKNNQWVQVSIQADTAGVSSVLTIPKAYIRDDGGQPYVYKANENGRLVKQEITTGKIYYGYYQEVLEGLTMDDKITFPYGKNVKSGVKTEDSDGSDMMY